MQLSTLFVSRNYDFWNIFQSCPAQTEKQNKVVIRFSASTDMVWFQIKSQRRNLQYIFQSQPLCLLAHVAYVCCLNKITFPSIEYF